MDDRQLLRDYAERRSEAAFGALVERHLGLVHSAARRLVQDPQLAEDVSQAVFVLLAQKAGSLSRESRISGWLYRTTCFVARRALRSESRRRQREQTAYSMQTSTASTSDDSWKEIAPHLDDAMESLGEGDRRALLIRFFEQRTHRDVADALGIGEEAAKKRTNRALEKLRIALQRHGVTVSVGALAAALGDFGVEAAPAGLAASIAPAAAASAAGSATVLPNLARETLRAWRWIRLQWIGAMVAGGTGLALLLAQLGAGPAANTLQPDASAVGTPAVKSASQTAAAGSEVAAVRPRPTTGVAGVRESILLLRVVDESTGQGVPAARLAIQWVANADWHHSLERVTDQTGYAEIRYPAGTTRMDVGILAEGWAARYATFLPHIGDAIPGEYTLPVARSKETVGGRIADEGGRPIAGAEIRIAFDGTGDSSNRETPRERFGTPIWKATVAKSDADGRWAVAMTAAEQVGFSLYARHPDFAEGAIFLEARTPGEERSSVTILKRGGVVAGRVLGPDGEPLVGATVAHEPHSVEPQIVLTDAEGRFTMPRIEEAAFEFVVTASGMAPEARKVNVNAGLAPMEITMKRAATLRLLLVDEDGAAVPDAEVVLEQWREHRQLLKWSAFSDATGRIVWDSAPPGDDLELCARGSGWCYTRDIRVTAGAEEHRVTLRRELRLSGVVVDARTRRPLAEFKVFPGYGVGEHAWERLETRRGLSGSFEIVFSEKRDPWRVRVEAEGYAPFISEPIAPGNSGTLEVAMEPVEPGSSIRGVVLGVDGKPAAGAQVALLTLEHDVRLRGREFIRVENDLRVVRADASGRFQFVGDAGAHSVAAVRADGFGKVRLGRDRGGLSVVLEPWGRIEGVVDASARRRPIEQFYLSEPGTLEFRGRVLRDQTYTRGTVYEDGRLEFVFEDVPPSEQLVWLVSGPGTPLHHRTPVRVEPGTTASVRIVTQGPTLRGRLVQAAGGTTSGAQRTVPVGGLSWAQLLSWNPSPPPPRPDGFVLSMEAVEYWQSSAGRAWATQGVNASLKIGTDGGFATDEEFPPGEYLLRVGLPDGIVERRIVVPTPAEGSREVDLGDVLLPSQDGGTPSGG